MSKLVKGIDELSPLYRCGYEQGGADGIQKACEILSDLISCEQCPCNCKHPTPGECIKSLCLYVKENIEDEE